MCQSPRRARNVPSLQLAGSDDAEEVVALAQRENCPSIAYTYNDPVIIGEFVIDVAHIARERGIRSVMVTAGYITPEARTDVFREIDAVNIDLKFFREGSYRRISRARLQPVLDAIRLYHELGVWVEVTTLVIPDLNDSDDETFVLVMKAKPLFLFMHMIFQKMVQFPPEEPVPGHEDYAPPAEL